MIDLKKKEFFEWGVLKQILHGQEKKIKTRILIEYMNNFFGYITQTSTSIPIICKVYNQEEDKCEVIQTTQRDFFQMMQNKKVKQKGKMVNIAVIWFNHERRQEYNGIIYCPRPLRDTEKTYLNTYTGFKYDKIDPNPYSTPEGDIKGNETLKIYLNHLKQICGDPRYLPSMIETFSVNGKGIPRDNLTLFFYLETTVISIASQLEISLISTPLKRRILSFISSPRSDGN